MNQVLDVTKDDQGNAEVQIELSDQKSFERLLYRQLIPKIKAGLDFIPVFEPVSVTVTCSKAVFDLFRKQVQKQVTV